MEYVVEWRSGTGGFSELCGGFHVKYASVKRNILLRFQYGSVIFSKSPMHFERNSLMEWKNGTVGFSQFGGAFQAKDASGQRNIAADYACVEARVNLTTFCVAFVGRKEGRKIVTGGTESAFPISFCLHRLRKEGAMGILLDEPKYPVIDRAPSAGTTISNFNLADWLRVTAITSASIPVGYLAGGSVNVRGPSMYTAGLIGLMGGFMYAYQCSAGRLMGMFPNDDEVARYKR